MKKLKPILFIAIMLTGQSYAQGQSISNQQLVQQTIVKLFDALSNRDSVSLKKYSTADITFYEYGEIWTIDTLITKAIATPAAADFKRTNHFKFINTIINKNMAWVTYHLQSEIFRDGKQVNVEWLETVTLAKEKKQWKVNHLHSTLVKKS